MDSPRFHDAATDRLRGERIKAEQRTLRGMTGSCRSLEREGVRRSDNAVMRIEFTLDCSNLERTSEFWQAAVGFEIDGRIADRYVVLSGCGIALTLQQVAEPKTTKNRMHIDLLVEDVEQEVYRLETLGASRLTAVPQHEFGQTWFVLTDPDGNKFCVAHESQ